MGPMRHLTNFPAERKPIYVEAVRRHGDPRFVIGEPTATSTHVGGGSLKCTANDADFAAFWKTFKEVEKSL